ncbi:DNA-directed RNA polymerase III 34kDa subunit [Spraguea lophii 42_110]|uniref:DNA-directed RNA polymerase III 34kDa subunit n=1 Tax=Spraguea lophii (strain 42_110) TaxID=1358809 RepID=S7W6U7_SPRLO|nr:DNA-directed RNA polymerase III 34kDa subunit [Spraguea lophii 42_110]
MKEFLEFIENSEEGVTEKEIVHKFPSLSKKSILNKLKQLIERKKIAVEHGNEIKYKRYNNSNHEEDIVKELSTHGALTLRELKLKTKIPQTLLTKLLKKMKNDFVIQIVQNFKNNTKMYMLYGTEHNVDVSGGIWFNSGNVDKEFVDQIIEIIYKYIGKRKVEKYDDHLTIDEIYTFIIDSGIITTNIKIEDLQQLMNVMCYDEVIQQLDINGKIGYRILNGL